MSAGDHAHPVIRLGPFSLRPSTEGDLDLLAGWFAEPEVFRWWGGRPLSREEVEAKYTGRRCPRVESHIVELERQPIGYIQYHVEGRGQAGLDMILLPEFRDRGLGPKVAQVLVTHLRSTFGWTNITVDPAADNPRAIRHWQKAGFEVEREWPDHPDGPALLMRLSPSAS
jgi:aminoglycoside 6'-N-acetyltransferase